MTAEGFSATCWGSHSAEQEELGSNIRHLSQADSTPKELGIIAQVLGEIQRPPMVEFGGQRTLFDATLAVAS